VPTATEAPCVHDGDANGDGVVTPGDAQLAFLFYLDCVGQDPDLVSYCAADFCGAGGIAACDGSVTPADAQGIMRFYLGYAEPCGKSARAAGNSAAGSIAISCGGGPEGLTVAEVAAEELTSALSAFGLQVRFDPGAFTFKQALPGDLDPGWTMFGARETQPGLLTVGGFSLDSLLPGSSGALAVLEFVRNEDQEPNGAPPMTIVSLADDLADWTIHGNGAELAAQK